MPEKPLKNLYETFCSNSECVFPAGQIKTTSEEEVSPKKSQEPVTAGTLFADRSGCQKSAHRSIQLLACFEYFNDDKIAKTQKTCAKNITINVPKSSTLFSKKVYSV
jgi:hypothetical protein